MTCQDNLVGSVPNGVLEYHCQGGGNNPLPIQKITASVWFNFQVHFLNSTHPLYRRGVFDVIGLRAELPHQKGNGASCMYNILLPLWKIA